MHHDRYGASGRSMRWYEWLAGLFLLSLAFGVRAGPVYKCVDASGATAFQDRPCAVAQTQSEMEIAPAPAYAPPPKYAVESHASRASFWPARSQSRSGYRDTAYECRASDGRVFYRLGACPRSLAAEGGSGRGRGKASISVSGHPVPRRRDRPRRPRIRRADFHL